MFHECYELDLKNSRSKGHDKATDSMGMESSSEAGAGGMVELSESKQDTGGLGLAEMGEGEPGVNRRRYTRT